MPGILRIVASMSGQIIKWLGSNSARLTVWATKLGVGKSATAVYNKLKSNPTLAALLLWEMAGEGIDWAVDAVEELFDDDAKGNVESQYSMLFGMDGNAYQALAEDPNTVDDVEQLEKFMPLLADMDYAASFFGGVDRLRRITRALAASDKDWKMREMIKAAN